MLCYADARRDGGYAFTNIGPQPLQGLTDELGVAAIAVLNNGLVHARQPREVAGMLTGALLLLALSGSVLPRLRAAWRTRHPPAIAHPPVSKPT